MTAEVHKEGPRVVIAANDRGTSATVKRALEEEGFVVCAEEGTSAGAVAASVRDRPDVCLVDLRVRGGGIEAAAAIHSKVPQTHVVVLTAARNDSDLFASLEAGASGYLLTETDPARLGPTLRGVLRGEAALPRELTARLIREFRARAQRGSAVVRRGKTDLTWREWEVLDCMCDGLSTRRISQRLFISQSTVRRHISSILRKLQVPNRQAAVELVAERSRNLNGD